MASDSSLPGSATHFAFDLDSQKGVTHLLASVRASKINPEQKNELRDLVFLYTNGGRDQSVRFTLEQKISTYGIIPLPSVLKPVTTEAVLPKPTFGASRPAPSFVASVKINASIPAASYAAPIKEETKTVTETAGEKVQVNNVVPTLAKETEPLSATVPPAQPKTAPPAPVEVVEKSVSYDPNQALSRIREIKSLVNDKVGNPVNLVDINNEVGREYMGALLDAMKKLNSGTSVISAMKRLETAYILVEKTIAEHSKQVEADFETKKTESSLPVTPIAKITTESREDVIPQSPIDTPDAIGAQESNVISQRQNISTVPTNDFVSKVAPVAHSDTPENLPTSRIDIRSFPTLDNVQMPRPEPAQQKPEIQSEKKLTPVKAEPAESEIVSAWGADTDTVSENKKKTVVEVPVMGKASSLAQAEIKPRTPNDLPLASSLETSSVAGDKLHTKQVDDGLEQLLLEWSLFKKSGLFGTGAKGHEHPLFKKIAGLQIPLLLAGRFEGATQEIKQSITDYMNGWRYEQGIIYEQGETFEHYLRRVIRHILDLQ